MKIETVKRLSLCSCGFPLFKVEIELGTQYEVDAAAHAPAVLICGGCGSEVPVTLVPARRVGQSYRGQLPAAVFREDG